VFVYEITGEDRNGRLIGKHKYSGLRPKFYERARYFGKERELVTALEQAEQASAAA
jgi:pilus assembly protein CpaF